ncbi:MAG: fibronectin type III domain-containing protein [Candidatus Pacebacteria bacterium]|nr:fibronectin type III domain-containing protein [Candidatus Paceibacterota bacterium]MDR3582997.1 fibronectin type III domain-containing protein [Candidatus Paceibacterota bacterium]
MKTKRLVVGVLIILAGLIFSNPVQAGSATVAWTASTDPTVTGYKVYYGTSTGNYTSSLDVGNVTQCTIPSLPKGQTIYAAVTAYDGTSESSYSSELIINFIEDGSNYNNWIIMKGNPPNLLFDSVLADYVASFGSSTGSAADYTAISPIPVAAHKVLIKYKVASGANTPYFVFSLTSTLGARNMIYKFQSTSLGGTGTNVTMGLGTANYGAWNTARVDLSADLTTAQPNNVVGSYGYSYVYSYLPTSAEIAEIIFYSN